MQLFDWVIAGSLCAVGSYLGLALAALITMDSAAFWLTVIYVLIPFGFVFVFIYFMNDLGDWIFSGRVKSFTPARMRKRRPLLLYFSLPAGVIIGVIGAQFGLGELLM
jgi:uncharacterized membrane protein YfcA